MKNWNPTGIIKTIVLVLLTIPNLFVPWPNQPEFNLVVCLLAFLTGGFFMYFVARYNIFILDRGYTEPEWNDNPFARNKPLAFFQFLSYLILFYGVTLIIGTAIKVKAVSSYGIAAFSFGFGMLLGTYLIAKKKRNTQA